MGGGSRNMKKNGYTLIELILVMMLLILFGLTTFTLVISASGTYDKLLKNKNNNSELRVALSYVNMKIRQNDVENSISLAKNPNGAGNAIVISRRIGKVDYQTWIYCSEGRLREALVEKGKRPADKLSFEIAEISGFSVRYGNNEKSLFVEVYKPYGIGSQRYSSEILINTSM